jgi:3-methyladenine DNA glycosylase Tag
VFADFDPSTVAKMDEDAIAEISGNKELKLAECRVRCVVENAKCIQKASPCTRSTNCLTHLILQTIIIQNFRQKKVENLQNKLQVEAMDDA